MLRSGHLQDLDTACRRLAESEAAPSIPDTPVAPGVAPVTLEPVAVEVADVDHQPVGLAVDHRDLGPRARAPATGRVSAAIRGGGAHGGDRIGQLNIPTAVTTLGPTPDLATPPEDPAAVAPAM